MKDFQLSSDDPRLTAYALGELDGDDRAVIEAALRRDPALRILVEEIRQAAARLEDALSAEAAGEIVLDADYAPAASAPILSSAATAVPAAPHVNGSQVRLYRAEQPKLLRFPQLYFIVSGLAAACFAVFVIWHEPAPAMPRSVRPPVVATATVVPAATGAAEAASDLVTVALPPSAPTAMADVTPTVAPTEAPAPGIDSVVEPAARLAPSGAPAIPSTAVAAADQPPSASKPIIREFNYTAPAIGSLTLSAEQSQIGAGAGATPTGPLKLGPGLDPGRNFATTPSQRAARPKQDGRPATKKTTGVMPSPAAGAASRPAELRVSPEISTPNATADKPIVTAPPSFVQMLEPARGPNLRGVEPQRPDLPVLGFVPPSPAQSGEERIMSLPHPAPNTEAYAHRRDSDFVGAKENPLSTFSIDADTASYTNVRRFLQSRKVPPADAVRIEELLNYFPYRYTTPAVEEAVPFAASLEVAEAPWAPAHRLVRIGLKGREVAAAARPAANLVFLLDVSGSMNQPNKLPLVKESIRLLLGKLRRDDRVAIVTYAGNSGLALESTPVANLRTIDEAIDSLQAVGSTNGAKGIQLAYEIAKANFTAGGINRVVLCTDGDFNVGVTSEGELVRLVEEKAESGVFLTVLGFGMGNLKDSLLEALAHKGNGHYGYIDTRREAEKLLVEQINSTLVTIAKDVKIQVEFNPAKVARYRLIGYENRALKSEDFNNDKVDAGEIGAGHAVTALYEIVPVGAEHKSPDSAPAPIDELKYQTGAAAGKPPAAVAEELLTVKVRYKEPAGDTSRRLEFPLHDFGARFAAASVDFKFAAAVAGFGMLLRESPQKGTTSIGDVIAWASAGAARTGDDPGGHRGEFLELARIAQSLLRGE